MELIDVLLKRRSIRKYTGDSIPEDKLEKIIQAGLLAPTSRNKKPCKFIIVRDKTILKKLSKAKKTGSRMLANCDVAIAVFADSKKSDTWVEDSSIALSFMHLMAAEQGVGSCWCQFHFRLSLRGIDSEEIARKLLEMDEKYRIVGVLALGIVEKELKPYSLKDINMDDVKYI